MTRKELIESATFMIRNYSEYPDLDPRRLYHCTAWIWQSNFSEWVLLQSYRTIVAAYNKYVETLFVFDHYSNTTCMHVAKFTNWLRYEHYPVSVKRVDLYNNSRTNKRVAQKNTEDDFASVIDRATDKK